MATLTGKVALVTGASRGIGRATAQALAKAGARVIVHYGRAAAEAEALVAEIRGAGGSADAAQADLSTPEGAASLAAEVSAIAGRQLDIFISNAGISKAASIENHSVEDFDGLFATNVRAPFFLLQKLLPVLGDGSSVVFITSLAARFSPGDSGVAGARACRSTLRRKVRWRRW
jgi:NAD(P)-dependent dehydrogenase (short-subunit alcohol dehydrogenase family)